MTRSYIKIYGPPFIKALRSLEKVAVDMSKKTTVRYYNTLVSPLPTPGSGTTSENYNEMLKNYVGGVLPDIQEITEAEKIKLISGSGETLGEYDFFFEWGVEPSKEQVIELIERIDEALAECNCRYTIVTK